MAKNFKKIVVNNDKEELVKSVKSSIPEDFKIEGYKVRKTPTISDIIIVEGLKGTKNKDELALNVYNRLSDLGITKTFRGDITKESVLNKVKANLRAFKKFKTHGFSLEENDDSLKLVNEKVL